MRIYIAGPMTGYKEHNFPAFHAEAARLRELGHEVVNPAEIHHEAADLVFATIGEVLEHWRKCMRADLTALLTCDTVAMLDGWTSSRGALLEHRVAMELGMAPRLAAFFVDPVGTCTRCGGAHRLSQCEWPLVAGAHPATTELIG